MSPSIDLTGESTGQGAANTPLLVIVALLAAAVMVIAFIVLRDTPGKGTAQQGRRPSA
jgi:hypothetical protein